MAGKPGRPRHSVAKTYLESVVLDTTASPPLRLQAAVALLRHEVEIKQSPGAYWPKGWEEAEL